MSGGKLLGHSTFETKNRSRGEQFQRMSRKGSASCRQHLVGDPDARIAGQERLLGGAVTVAATGLLDRFKSRSDLDVIDAFEKDISLEESWERRRRAFSVDLYLTGTNAVTETGHLVNLDRTGNRVAALAFGPRSVVVFAGRNKIVPGLEEAFARVKSHAAPINAMRLKYKTPCAKTAVCQECNSPDRLCNTWAITEKSFPKGRITVILINQDLGF